MAAKRGKKTVLADITFVHVKARKLFTVRPDAPLWQMAPGMPDLDVAAEMSAGPLVRLFPPADAAPSLVDAMEEGLVALGAKAVRRMPAQLAPSAARKAPEHAAPLTIRAAVAQMVQRWGETDTARREALAKLVSETMDAEGL